MKMKILRMFQQKFISFKATKQSVKVTVKSKPLIQKKKQFARLTKTSTFSTSYNKTKTTFKLI